MDHSYSDEDTLQEQPENLNKSERMINVRKLAALDIVYHGPDHSLFAIVLGCFLLWIALNYVPLFLYAISIVKQKSAHQEVAYELEHKDTYAVKYTLQSTLLLVPLAIPMLTAYQELQKRGKR